MTDTTKTETGQATPTIKLSAAPTGNLPAARNKPKIVLSPEDQATVDQSLTTADIAALSLPDIATFASEPEKNLGNILDGFLERIDVFDNPPLFALVTKLGDKVEEQKLGEVADKILNSKPTFWQQVQLVFSSKKARRALLDKIWGKTQELARNRTTTLKTVVDDLERELQTEQAKQFAEIAVMNQLKGSYKEVFREFAVATVFADAFVQKAEAQVATFEKSMDPNSQEQRTELEELKNKLQALQSRALALEGTYTRLPADQLVIRQLEQAGISTLQETTTTAMQRFNSIKMTLVTLNSGLVTQNLQRIAESGKVLDEQLDTVRGMITKQVVTSAANAPGENRVAQANQIKQIVSETEALVGIVEHGRASNKKNFDIARKSLADSRQNMLRIAKKIN